MFMRFGSEKTLNVRTDGMGGAQSGESHELTVAWHSFVLQEKARIVYCKLTELMRLCERSFRNLRCLLLLLKMRLVPLMLRLSRFSTHINATELTPELRIPLEIVGLSGI